LPPVSDGDDDEPGPRERTKATSHDDDATSVDAGDAVEVDAPANIGPRPISGPTIMPPAEFQTILGTADEVTFELPEFLDLEDLPRGTTIAGNVILTRHAESPLGVAYTAYDGRQDGRVVLHLLPLFADESTERHDRLVTELRGIARLSHPCIAAVLDVGLWIGGVFVVSEMVEGISLRTWVDARDEPFAWREVLRVFHEVGRALVTAHASSIHHGDLTPEQIILGEGGRVKVRHFGLRAVADEAPEDRAAAREAIAELRRHLGIKSATDARVGSLEYAAPEVLAGEPTSPKSDQFSFCVALYEALYGERPFRGTSLGSLAAEYVHDEPRAAPSGSKVPPWLRAIVLRGLAVRPADRWPTLERLQRELDRDPQASRRRWQLGLLAVAVVGGGVAAASWWSQRTADRCARTSDEFVGSWDQTRRAELQRSFIAGGAPHAAQTFETTADVLDAWNDEWVDQHVAACEATLVRADAPQKTLDTKRQCLARAEQELLALLGAFEVADRGQLDHGPLAAESLTPPRICARAAGLVAQQSDDGGEGGTLADLGERLDRGWAALRLGQPQRASELVRDVDVAAADVPLGPAVLVSALHLRGAAAAALDQADEAEGLLHRAATSANRDNLNATLVAAWLDLAALIGGEPGRQIEAAHVLEHARAVVDRARFDWHRWRIDATSGAVAAAAGRHGDAATHYRQALVELEQFPDLQWARLDIGLALGKVMTAHGDPAAALAQLGSTHDDARRRLGASHPLVVEILLAIGDTHQSAGSVAEARTAWQGALASAIEGAGADSLRVAELRIAIAERLRNAGSADDALDHTLRAVEAARSNPAVAPTLTAALLEQGRVLLALERERTAIEPLTAAFEQRDASLRELPASTSTAARKQVASAWLEAATLLSRAHAADLEGRAHSVALARRARTVASEHGLPIGRWLTDLARRSSPSDAAPVEATP
jgi:tetratricopeptide (TPR) repeat protein